MKKLIVIIDDEPDIRELVRIHLQKANFKVVEFSRSAKFWDYIKRHRPALIVLDLMLPDADGFEICRNLKSHTELGDVPVIILSAKGEETDKVLGLELGADDYVSKPFSPKELVARIKAVLRRTPESKLVPETEDSEKLVLGKILKLDLNKYEVFVKGEPVELTTTEFKLLKLLTGKPGWVFSRDQILEFLWGEDKAVIDRTVDVHIRNLRKKLKSAGKLIKNVRGVGYTIKL